MKHILTVRHEKLLERFFEDYEWIHLIIGIIGNVLFFCGSIMFMFEIKPWSLYMFVSGSFLMLIGSLGSALVRHVYRHHGLNRR